MDPSVFLATQVTHEGSDTAVYQVGKIIKERFPVLKSYDMTLEASVTKMMWILSQTTDLDMQYKRPPIHSGNPEVFKDISQN